MKNEKVILMTFLLALTVSLVNAAIVDISVDTDKDTYLLDEDILVSITAYNPGDTVVDLSFASDLQASYLIDGIYDWEEGRSRLPWVTYVAIDPYDSFSWELNHGVSEMLEYPLDIGIHTLVGEVLSGELLIIGESLSPSIEFEVVPEAATVLVFGLGMFLLRSKKD